MATPKSRTLARVAKEAINIFPSLVILLAYIATTSGFKLRGAFSEYLCVVLPGSVDSIRERGATRLSIMEKVEIAIRVIGVLYALAMLILIIKLQNQDINNIMLITVYTMVFTCPCLWALIRFCREWTARRRMVVLPDRKPKKKPDIALPKDKQVQRTQAEILAEQRARVANLHSVGEPKKKKPKSPKRKGPPSKKN